MKQSGQSADVTCKVKKGSQQDTKIPTTIEMTLAAFRSNFTDMWVARRDPCDSTANKLNEDSSLDTLL